MDIVLSSLCFAMAVMVVHLYYRNRQLVQENRKLKKDRLTGLPNRYGIDEWIEREKPKSWSVGVVFVDIDGLKDVNDDPNRGHSVGDEFLRIVSRALSLAIREGDLTVRQGGDEFLVLLHDVDQQSIRLIAQRIRRFCLPVSVSIGWALSYNQLEPMSEVIARADLLMLIEKNKKHAAKKATASD